MFRKYLYEEIERAQDKVSDEMFNEWCEIHEGMKESAFKAGFDAALLWIKEIIMERTTEEREQYHREMRR